MLQGDEFTYLVHFPKWGTPLIVTFAPRCWGLSHPWHFSLLRFSIPGFPMKKPVHQIPQRGAFAANIDDMVDRYPMLAEMLAATAYEGEAPGSRVTATLLLFAQDLSWKAVLRDRQEGRALWVSTLTFLDVFAVMENALGDPAAVWRDDRVGGAAEAKRQKPGK